MPAAPMKWVQAASTFAASRVPCLQHAPGGAGARCARLACGGGGGGGPSTRLASRPCDLCWRPYQARIHAAGPRTGDCKMNSLEAARRLLFLSLLRLVIWGTVDSNANVFLEKNQKILLPPLSTEAGRGDAYICTGTQRCPAGTRACTRATTPSATGSERRSCYIPKSSKLSSAYVMTQRTYRRSRSRFPGSYPHVFAGMGGARKGVKDGAVNEGLISACRSIRVATAVPLSAGRGRARPQDTEHAAEHPAPPLLGSTAAT